ncbi:CMRF35-like molecule 5 isoform X2 [Alosa pseudoharengus]|uniref:CMRF35-like molecule 5 isoform X2 n=1 Tax=Alosa pseudoharengus TaxID=34774 RepID=UPI003F8CB6A3
MKTGVTLTLFPLTMLSCVTCKDITVRGYEGGHAVFNCPVGVFTSSPKYLLKGDYDEIIRSDGNKEWTHRGRVSLKYKNNNNFFSVTIHKLTLKDAGTYWCGVDTWGPDLYYTKVNHEVDTLLILFLLVPKSPLGAPQPMLAAFQWLHVLQLPYSHLRTQQGNQNRHLSLITPQTFSLIPHQVHQLVLCTSVLVWLWWCLCWCSASLCSTHRRPEAGRHQLPLLDKNLTPAQEIPNSVTMLRSQSAPVTTPPDTPILAQILQPSIPMSCHRPIRIQTL